MNHYNQEDFVVVIQCFQWVTTQMDVEKNVIQMTKGN